MNPPPSVPSPRLAFFLGLFCVITGFLAISSPFYAGAAAMVFIAVLMVFSGVAEIVAALRSRSEKAGVLAFLSGALSLVAGIVVLNRPLMGMAVLVLVLGFYFGVDGIGKVILSLRLKPEPGWGVLMFGGIVTTLLGFLILRQWPLSGVWAIGILLGVNMLTSGFGLLAVAQGLKQLQPPE